MARKAAFFDVDGTLTTERVWRGILDYFKLHNQRRFLLRWFWIYHTPHYLLHKAGLMSQGSFRTAWAAHLTWFFKGYTPEQSQPIWDWVVAEYLAPIWRAEGLQRLKEHKAAGDLVMLVSAGPTPLLDTIARHVGADMAVGTEPELREGRYSGRLAGPVCIDEQKALLSQAAMHAAGQDIDYGASSAYADSRTDLDMLEMVGHPVAFYPDEFLRPIARERGWAIVE
ncbi:MAG: HAD family hydrolase [Anaerolineales bacterium]|nr:HAD family hydrolase [Anaerolineales bacterium]